MENSPLLDLERGTLPIDDVTRWVCISAKTGRRGVGKNASLISQRSIAHVADHLYLGTLANAVDESCLSSFHITHVLNCAGFDYGVESVNRNIIYKRVGDVDNSHKPVVPIQLLANSELEMIPMDDLNSVSPKPLKAIKTTSQMKSDDWLGSAVYECVDFLEKARKAGGRVLLCCVSGMNRSPLVIAGYLMIAKRLCLLESVEKVRDATGVVLQLEGYLAQLVQLAHREGLLSNPYSQPPDVDDLSEFASSYGDDDELWNDGFLEDDAYDYHSESGSSFSSVDSDSLDGMATAGTDHDDNELTYRSTTIEGKSSNVVRVRNNRRLRYPTERVLPTAAGIPKNR